MTDQNAAVEDDATPTDEGTEQVPESDGSQPPADADFWRKRQAGADAARAAAERKAKELEAELAKYREIEQKKQQAELSAEARLQAKLEEAERRAAEAEARAEARILDARFPNARAKLPEVTDEVRLAEFEALLREPDAEPPATIRGMRAAKPASSTGIREEESAADIFARLKTMGNPFAREG